MIIPSVNEGSFISSFSVCISICIFYFPFLPIALSRTFSTVSERVVGWDILAGYLFLKGKLQVTHYSSFFNSVIQVLTLSLG